jgi:integrase
MPLKVVRRKNRRNALTISGTLRLGSGRTVRIERRASTDDPCLAAEEARVLEAQMLRTDWHGERKGTRSFAGAVLAYFEAEQRTDGTKARYNRVLRAIGDRPLSDIDQDTVTELRKKLMRPNCSPSTVTREIINPLRAIMRLAAERKWCDPVKFTVPKESDGRTLYLKPDETERLIAAASDHLKPLLIFLICTGARVSEALELEWRDVDLVGARAILWRTKARRRRNLVLPPRCVDALAGLPHCEGVVFRAPSGEPYADHYRRSGGQFKTAWKGAIRRAGLDPEITPHTLRHTWASWHYALNKDPIRLKQEGGWSDLKLVERYAHLLPAGHEGRSASSSMRPHCDRRILPLRKAS